MIDYLNVLLLGVVEGLTEFIPVSSTGHLIIFEHIFPFQSEAKESFEIFIQLGAILAVVFLYPKRFAGLFAFGVEKDGFCGWAGIRKLFFASLPVFCLGPLLHSWIKRVLFEPFWVAIALLVGGLLFIVLDKKARPAQTVNLNDISVKQAFLIGLIQCFALWPGMSRSGSTIIGGLLAGLERKVAAEFSFLVAVPVMCAAVAYDLLKSAASISANDIPAFLLGFFVSFVVAIFAIRFFIGLLKRWTLAPFGYYRIVVAILVVWLLR